MTSEEQMVESHVREYNSRLKHIDELIERAANSDKLKPEQERELSELKQEREKMAEQLSAAEWAKQGGPMVIWDIVAERLEKLIEHIE